MAVIGEQSGEKFFADLHGTGNVKFDVCHKACEFFHKAVERAICFIA